MLQDTSANLEGRLRRLRVFKSFQSAQSPQSTSVHLMMEGQLPIEASPLLFTPLVIGSPMRSKCVSEQFDTSSYRRMAMWGLVNIKEHAQVAHCYNQGVISVPSDSWLFMISRHWSSSCLS